MSFEKIRVVVVVLGGALGTTLLKGRQEKKNLSTKLPVVGIRESIFWIDAIGIKIFHRALFEKSEFENFQYFQLFSYPE